LEGSGEGGGVHAVAEQNLDDVDHFGVERFKIAGGKHLVGFVGSAIANAINAEIAALEVQHVNQRVEQSRNPIPTVNVVLPSYADSGLAGWWVSNTCPIHPDHTIPSTNPTSPKGGTRLKTPIPKPR
jgi:hypothetical protein